MDTNDAIHIPSPDHLDLWNVVGQLDRTTHIHIFGSPTVNNIRWQNKLQIYLMPFFTFYLLRLMLNEHI